MSYNWTNGELITAEKLNATGGGALILTYHSEGDYVILNKTWQEIRDAFVGGQNVMLADIDDEYGDEEYFPIYSLQGEPPNIYTVEFMKKDVFSADTPDGYPYKDGK